MRAIALATTVVIAIAMSATPTLAADRTVQPLDGDRELTALSEWVGGLERAWLGFILPGPGSPVLWTSAILSAEDTVARAAAKKSADDGPTSVILEDGAPF